MIKFRCGACGRKMGVPDGYGGKRVKCIGCGEGIRVPAPAGGAEPEELVTLEPVEEDHDRDLDPDGGIFDDLMPTDTPMAAAHAAVAAPPAGASPPVRELARPGAGGERLCPKCGASARGDAATCINCGHSFKLGVNVQTVATAKRAAGLAGRTTFAMIAGGVAAIIGGGIWAVIGLTTDREFGILAWALGGFVGFAMAAVARAQNPMVGAGAAGWTVVALLLGKVFIFQWVVPGAIATEFRNDPEVVWNAVAVDMLRTGDLAEGQLAHIGEHQESGGTLPLDDDIKRRVDGQLSGMSEAEIDAALDAYVGAVFGEVPWSEQIGALLSPWDLLWVFLALATAFKVGSGVVVNE